MTAEASRPARGIVGRIFANLGLLLSGRAAAGLLSLGYLVIAARALGPRDYGVLVLIHGYSMTVGGIIGFPGWHAVVRYGVGPLAEDDAPALVRLLRYVGSIELAAGALAVLVAALLAPIIGPRLGWSPVAQAFAVPYSLAVLASVRTTPAGFLQLIRRFDLLALHSAVAPSVRLVGAAIVAFFGWGLIGFLVAWLAAALAEWASMWTIGWWQARKVLGHHRFFGRPTDLRRERPGIGRFMLAANADVTFSDLAGRIVPLMIGWLMGPAAAGLFSVAQRATVVIAQPAQVLGQAAYSELAKLVASGGHGRPVRRALMKCVGIALASATPVILLLAFFSKDFVVLLGGKAFAGAAGIMIWLVVARTVLLVGPPSSAALTAMGRPAFSVAANAGTNLGLLPLLPPLLAYYGLPGAGMQAMLQAIAASALLAWLVVYVSRHPPRETSLSHSTKSSG